MLSNEFLLTSLLVVLVPGTGAMYTISHGVLYGWRASVLAAIGSTLSIVPHLAISIVGLAMVLHTSAVAFQVLKLLGSAYLLYLAWQMWRGSGELSLGDPLPQRTPLRVIGQGVLINLLNPKLTLFFVAFFPLFLAPDAANQTVQMTRLGAAFMVMTLAVFVVYGLLASRLRERATGSPRLVTWLQRSFALAFAAFGLRLAFGD